MNIVSAVSSVAAAVITCYRLRLFRQNAYGLKSPTTQIRTGDQSRDTAFLRMGSYRATENRIRQNLTWHMLSAHLANWAVRFRALKDADTLARDTRISPGLGLGYMPAFTFGQRALSQGKRSSTPSWLIHHGTVILHHTRMLQRLYCLPA